MMTNETEAPVTVFSDHAPEAVILALEDQVDALEDQVDAKDKRIAELERSEHDIACLLCDAYGAMLDWDEVLKERADHEAEARIADLEANLATAVAELEREADNHEEDADYHDDNCNDPDKSFHRGQAQRLRTIIAALKGPNQ